MGKTLSLVANLCLIGNLLAVTAWPQTGAEWTIDTIAGRGVGDNGPAVEALLSYPSNVAVDGAGNLYIADTDNNRVRRVDPSGTITTIAGTGASGYSGDGGPAVEAQLARPLDVAVDGAGNLYIADLWNHRIRQVDTKGIITTIAGTGSVGPRNGGYSGDNGPADQARLARPSNLAVDSTGNLYIADYGNERIRRVDASGSSPPSREADLPAIAGTATWRFTYKCPRSGAWRWTPPEIFTSPIPG